MSKCKCGHEQGQHIYDEGLCRPGFICDCKSFSPAEPKCAECGDADHVGRECGATKFAGDEIGVCRCYRPAEPDATERARAFFVKQGKWDLAERFDGWQCCELMTAFLESERPRIKADAVREFIAEVEKEIIEPSGDDLFDGHQLLTTGSVLRVMRSIQARQVAKEMTEEAK